MQHEQATEIYKRRDVAGLLWSMDCSSRTAEGEELEREENNSTAANGISRPPPLVGKDRAMQAHPGGDG